MKNYTIMLISVINHTFNNTKINNLVQYHENYSQNPWTDLFKDSIRKISRFLPKPQGTVALGDLESLEVY